MNVLHVYQTYFPDTQGGIQEVIRQITLNTTQQVTSRIFTLSRQIRVPQKVSVRGVEVYQVPQCLRIQSCGFAIKGLNVFHNLCTWADIIHYHFPWPFADLLHFIFAYSKSKKIVISYHADIIRQKILRILYKPLMNAFLGRADCIVVSSYDYLSSSATLLKFQEKAVVIPIGINESCYPVVAHDRMQSWKRLIGGDFFLFVGVLRYYKGLDTLLAAAVDAKFKVVIAGSGPLEGALQHYAKQLNLDNVIFLGQIHNDDKVALLKLAIGFVFPSPLRAESFGLSLLEAAMFGKPLISANINSGTSSINFHQLTGIQVEPNDPVGLRHAMELIYTQPTLAARFGTCARKRYEALFTGQQMGERFEQLYNRLLA